MRVAAKPLKGFMLSCFRPFKRGMKIVAAVAGKRDPVSVILMIRHHLRIQGAGLLLWKKTPIKSHFREKKTHACCMASKTLLLGEGI